MVSGQRKSTRIVRTALPVHDNLLPTRLHSLHTFGREPPPGLEVRLDGEPLPFERLGRKDGTWGFDRDYLYIGLAEGDPIPSATALQMVFSKATATENSLNLDTSELDPVAFVGRTVTVGETSHTGLLLPAPASAQWRVTVPEAAVLTFEGTVLHPAVATPIPSDGAVIEVVVTEGGVHHSAGRVPVQPGRWDRARLDLSAFAGREVHVSFVTEPGARSDLDYVFIEGPALYTPTADPRRLLLVFVDTLRPDHLGLYGYDRPTTPILDGWAQEAAVFEQARSVAPWTLPSARAALSGRQPERWYEGPVLAERLSAAGWHTEGIVTNAFLSQPFDMHDGWDRYRYEHLWPADDLVRYAQRILGAHHDRDTVVMVHLMEAHLPYHEGLVARQRFAGATPEGLEHLTRTWLVEQDGSVPSFAPIREYVIGRYDNNIRVIDSALGPLLRMAGADATVALFSDHGEEFWDHGEFEHGHSFYDELLQVPLVLRGPGVPAGRVPEPVSLLDLTPTLLQLAGLDPGPPEPGGGRSLVPILWDESGADSALRARSHGFGRPLYGDDGWGAVAGGKKWWDRGGRQQLYSLDADPDERVDLAPGASGLGGWSAALSDAVDRDVVLTWRLSLHTTQWPLPVTVTVSHPDGVSNAWSAYDPRNRTLGSRPEVVDGQMVLTIPARGRPPPVLFVQPQGDPRHIAGLRVALAGHQLDLSSAVPVDAPALVDDPAKHPLVLEAARPGFTARVDLGWAPVPDGVEVSGFHADLAEQLHELGYMDDQ